MAATLAILPIPSRADRPDQAEHKIYHLGDFKLESGEVIKNVFLTYVTHGKLNEKQNNAILVLPSLMATHHRHDFLIGPDNALDPEKYFIICADTIGNGRAISPSNSKDQPGMKFPQFSIRDMVNAQHELVTKGLGIKRLLAVLGLSMGGMQTYQWAVSYADAMDGIIPIITMAKTTGWVTAIWETHRQAIMADAVWNGGNYTAQPEKGFRAAISSLLVWVRHWDWADTEFGSNNKAAIIWLNKAVDPLLKIWDANNYIYQTHAEDLYNIGNMPGFDGDYRKALRSIKAKALLLPSSTDLLHPADDSREAVRYIRDARLFEIPSRIGHLGGGGVLIPDIELMNKTIGEFLNVLTKGGKTLK